MAQIAAEAGVSKNTVSLALRGDRQVTEETRQRIEEISQRLGYQRNPLMSHLMAVLRQQHPVSYRYNLALVNAHRDPNAFTRNPTVPEYVQGCLRRAKVRGYRFDEFWIHDPALTGPRLDRILRSRGIRGLIIIGLFSDQHLPETFRTIWENYPAVVTGVRTTDPSLPFACVDHHEVIFDAMENVRRLGYRRPGLVLQERIDRLIDGRFSAAFQVAQEGMAKKNIVPPFAYADDDIPRLQGFREWIETYEPDVILTLHPNVRDWLQSMGKTAPDDIGLVALEVHRKCADWAGMNQHNDIAGEAAVDMVGTLMQTNEFGGATPPRATLIGGTWVDGLTVCPQV
jgi:DNA-binding LacI/PurR family transcriptional regulator